MEEFVYRVYECIPKKDAADTKRFIWEFDDEYSAQGLKHFLEANDIKWPCIKVEKKEVSELDG